MVKKIIFLLLLMIMITGCTKAKEQQNTHETNAIKNSNLHKVLIAYFSWADNTVVEDQQASIESALQHYESVGDRMQGADATSSASILQPGNVSKLAMWIQEEIDGDLFSIQVTDSYPSNYDECLERAADEKAANARPSLKEKIANIDDYDTIFIGYPNWWYSVPMPVLTFIDENDLENKNIVLFCCHGTGGLARSVEDIENELPDSVHLEKNVIGIYRNEINDAKQKILEWLNDIGY